MLEARRRTQEADVGHCGTNQHKVLVVHREGAFPLAGRQATRRRGSQHRLSSCDMCAGSLRPELALTLLVLPLALVAPLLRCCCFQAGRHGRNA